MMNILIGCLPVNIFEEYIKEVIIMLDENAFNLPKLDRDANCRCGWNIKNRSWIG